MANYKVSCFKYPLTWIRDEHSGLNAYKRECASQEFSTPESAFNYAVEHGAEVHAIAPADKEDFEMRPEVDPDSEAKAHWTHRGEHTLITCTMY